MRNRVLGNNHLSVSSIRLGCWGMSHAYGKADERESLATIDHCLNLGINFLDTADVFGDGHNDMDIDVYGDRHNTYNLQFIDTEF